MTWWNFMDKHPLELGLLVIFELFMIEKVFYQLLAFTLAFIAMLIGKPLVSRHSEVIRTCQK